MAKKGVNTVADDTVTLALHALTSAGFGVDNHFRIARELPENGFTMTFQESLATVLKNPALVVVVPHNILLLLIFSRRFARVGRAAKEFKRYMVDLLNKESQLISQGIYGADNLLSVLVQNLDDA